MRLLRPYVSFFQSPRQAEHFVRALTDIAAREPAFAQQLQTLAQQANIQTGGVQGSVNVSGQGKVYGTTGGVITGTVTGNYTLGKDDEQAT
ncbi:hypothetical protein [Candidatus Viridilinea mediisalina]|uniref:hypothetical protein n=1 Tax=Candidatus Viridilinea mediisalina TaxID=2024553 RepID=UPI000F5B667B|nr:hypothetical protein [Candidatus Viridilinea mediisalina]